DRRSRRARPMRGGLLRATILRAMRSWWSPASSRRGAEVTASAPGPRAPSTSAHLHMLDLESIIECKAALIQFYRGLSSEDLHSFKFAVAQTSADLHSRHYRPLP